MTQLFAQYGFLWLMVSVGLACFVVAAGVALEADWRPVLLFAVAVALLWPLGTVALIAVLLSAVVISMGISASLLPVNLVLALRGKEPIKPYPPSEKAKGAAS